MPKHVQTDLHSRMMRGESLPAYRLAALPPLKPPPERKTLAGLMELVDILCDRVKECREFSEDWPTEYARRGAHNDVLLYASDLIDESVRIGRNETKDGNDAN